MCVFELSVSLVFVFFRVALISTIFQRQYFGHPRAKITAIISGTVPFKCFLVLPSMYMPSSTVGDYSVHFSFVVICPSVPSSVPSPSSSSSSSVLCPSRCPSSCVRPSVPSSVPLSSTFVLCQAVPSNSLFVLGSRKYSPPFRRASRAKHNIFRRRSTQTAPHVPKSGLIRD